MMFIPPPPSSRQVGRKLGKLLATMRKLQTPAKPPPATPHHNMSITTEIQQCQDEAREGWMPEKKSAPDFGEPWKKSILTGFIETKHGDAAHTAADRMSRVITCVNACAGMADPAKEIQAMREAIKEAHEALKELRSFYLDMTGLPPCAANASLAKVKQFLP